MSICSRCYDEVPTFPANCAEKPENTQRAVGMYHCPDCGAMVIAGLLHMQLCARCIERNHPQFDGPA